MKIIGFFMVLWAWVGGGWWFLPLGWIIFELGSLIGGVYKTQNSSKIQTVRKQD